MTEAEKIAREMLLGDFVIAKIEPRIAHFAERIEALATRLASEAAADMRQRAAGYLSTEGKRHHDVAALTRGVLALPLLPDGASEGREVKRCTICGFVVDTRYKAEKPTIDFSTAGRSKKDGASEGREGGWRPVEPPRGVWLRTKREGEAGENVSMYMGEGEWSTKDGRTTVTHSTFLAPTHWMPSPPSTEGGKT